MASPPVLSAPRPGGRKSRPTNDTFYQPNLSTDLDSPFIRDGEDRLIRRSYWLDMDDRTLVMVMVNGIGCKLDQRGEESPFD